MLTCGTSSAAGVWLNILPLNQPSVTVMRFSVSVPVLSLQMAVAPPMVSHAASTLWTRKGGGSEGKAGQSKSLKEHCLVEVTTLSQCKLQVTLVVQKLLGWLT